MLLNIFGRNVNKDKDKNVILSDTERLDIHPQNERSKSPVNGNVLVIGSAGADKDSCFFAPNILQMNSNYVVMDKNLDLLKVTGNALRENDYHIQVLDLENPDSSYHYNPLDYLYDKNGGVADELVRDLAYILNASLNEKKDVLWEKMSLAFLDFAIHYLVEFMPAEERNLSEILKLIESGCLDPETDESALDELITDARKKKPDSKCFIAYDTFKLSPKKTTNSILITLAAGLKNWQLKYGKLFTTDYVCGSNNEKGDKSSKNIDFDQILSGRTALFINRIPGAPSGLDAVLLMQLNTYIYVNRGKEYDAGTKVWNRHIQFMNGDVADSSPIRGFDKIMATCRKYDVSFMLATPSLMQLKVTFGQKYESAIANCDSIVYLGSNDNGDHEYIAKRLGKTTIIHDDSDDVPNLLDAKGIKIDTNKISRLGHDFCIVFTHGLDPRLSHKYDISYHPEFKNTAYCEEKNLLNIKELLK